MKNFISSIFSLLLLLTVISVHAETTRYNIEIVIFEDTSGRYINSEQWPIIHHPEAEFSIETKSTKSGIKKKKLSDNKIMELTHHANDALSKHVTRLNGSDRYNVLLHKSWQQTGLDDTDAISIQVDTSEEKNTKENQELKSSLQGSLKLVLGRYLHIHTDLLYKRLNNTDRQTAPALNSKIFSEFKIQSQRRMRSKELHYIDHPLVGILVIVNPIEQPEAEKMNN